MNETISILVILQIIYAVLIVTIGFVTVFWCIRSGQFNKQEDASRLPLEIEDWEEETSD